MNDNPQRVEEFKSAIGDLKLRDPSTKTERQWLVIGIVCMVAALVIAIYAYFQSGKEEALEQNELISLGLAAIVLTLVGIALFLRYSFGRLLRFWLVRIVYEMRAVTDQVPSSNSSAPGVVTGGPRDDQTTTVP